MTGFSCETCFMNYLASFTWPYYRYDAIIVGGDLDWQDKLNKHNKPFFDTCESHSLIRVMTYLPIIAGRYPVHLTEYLKIFGRFQ